MTTLTQRTASRLFTAGNNAGNGESADYETTTVAATVAAYVADGATEILTAATDDEVSVVLVGNRVLAIGDANGPWVVDITPTSEAIEALRDGAGQAGDMMQVALCCRALDDETTLSECAASDSEKATARAMSIAAAAAVCAEALAD